jgi:hypothetical protein
MIKVMHVDNVFEVFIFLILIFGYFFYARRGAYLMMIFSSKTLSGASRHKASEKSQSSSHYNQIHHFQGIKRWKRDGKKKKMWTPPIPRQSQGIHKCGNVCGVQIFLVEVKFEI